MAVLKDLIFQADARARAQRWTYPQLFDFLKDSGVTGYETVVGKHEITYVSATEKYVAPPPPGFAPAVPAALFNVAEIKKAILRAQRRETTYTQFLAEIAAAGVHRYRVDMAARQIDYKGAKGEIYVEKIPQA
jgi:uncharacterized protein YbcV (DUF1398 family)